MQTLSPLAPARAAAVQYAREILATATDPYTGQAVLALPSVAQLQADELEAAHLRAQEAEAMLELMYGADARLATAAFLGGR